MQLQADSPLRMTQHILQDLAGGPFRVSAVHRLEKKMPEIHFCILFRFESVLRINKLQLIAAHLRQFNTGLGTDTNPVNARRRCERAIGFQGDIKTFFMQIADQRVIKLQKRLPARADNQRPC